MTLNPADSAFAADLQTRLSQDVFRKADARYFEEPHGRVEGQAGLVLAPRTVDQVATIVSAAAHARVPVIPYGGGTGLVGGQVSLDGPVPVILSLERLNRVRAVYPSENVLIVEAGVILADVQAAAEKVDRLFPLSLAAEGTARIGGNLATNAGGVNVLRYGNARDLCLGLEAVLPDGSVWNGLSRLRKDNTGYDLRNLLIGSEGTLGIITAAALKMSPRPAQQGTALMVLSSPQAALDLLSLARDQIGEGISAFELMNRQGLEFLAETLPHVRQPFEDKPEWCVLIEIGVVQALDPIKVFETLFEAAAEAGLVMDGLIAQSKGQSDEFWSVRENMPEANRRMAAVSSHDISIPISVIPDFIAAARDRIATIGEFRTNCFGHVGDGNLHFNVFPMPGKTRADHADQRSDIKYAIHDLVHEMHGSISAEHGIGRLKVDDLERYGDPVKLAAMRAIKAALDPLGILNPGAVLRC
jgi:FAD/FMN-containing dehydrogenase